MDIITSIERIILFKGYTLTEILITLGVISVVAVITVPSVINKYKEQTTVIKVKKFYSIINQAYLLSVNDHGPVYEWNVEDGKTKESAKQIMSYLKPYLKILRDCGTNSGCLGHKNNVYNLNGSQHSYNYDTDSKYYKIILVDGSYIWCRGENTWCRGSGGGHSNSCAVIFIDINGSKGPNTAGKDIFDIFITTDGVKPNITDTCTISSTGFGCSGYILEHGNMNYLH